MALHSRVAAVVQADGERNHDVLRRQPEDGVSGCAAAKQHYETEFVRPPNTKEEIALIERKVLCSICQGALEGSLRELARATLRNYTWQNTAHQVIFEVLTAIPSESPDVIRAQLPSRLTRLGFPDLDWEWLFAAPRLPKPEVEGLILTLHFSVDVQPGDL
jgi:hypothetical protein